VGPDSSRARKGIRVGPGRGSSAGCCIAYCLRIVDLDPLRYGLIFERFLNPDVAPCRHRHGLRRAFPRRHDPLRRRTLRLDHVAQIVTFSTIKARAAVRDAARVLGYPPQLGDKIAKAMPPLVMGQDLPLGACLSDARLRGALRRSGRLRALYESDPDVKHSIDVAMGFVDKRRQDGIHAAAVVITKEPMLDYVPVQRKSGPSGSGEDAPIVTQYEATAIEKLGLLKMDFLGLRNLAIIERALENIRRRHGVEVDIDNVALDDPRSTRCCDSATRSVSSSSRATRCANSCDAWRRPASMTSRPQRAVPPGTALGERAQRLRRSQERPSARELRHRIWSRSSARPRDS